MQQDKIGTSFFDGNWNNFMKTELSYNPSPSVNNSMKQHPQRKLAMPNLLQSLENCC